MSSGFAEEAGAHGIVYGQLRAAHEMVRNACGIFRDQGKRSLADERRFGSLFLENGAQHPAGFVAPMKIAVVLLGVKMASAVPIRIGKE